MIELYWNVGRTILDRQQNEPWGSKVLERLARDLRAEFPHMKGFSRTNVYNMRAFAAAWDGPEPIVQTPSGQLSWSHDVALLNKLDDHELRRWDASKAVQYGWSLAVMEQPKVAASWHPTLNGELTPAQILASGKKPERWWICEAGHEYQRGVSSRVRGYTCRYCSGRASLPGHNDLTTSRPDWMADWDDAANRGVRPTNITDSCMRRYWWKCSICGALSQESPHRRSRRAVLCPECRQQS